MKWNSVFIFVPCVKTIPNVFCVERIIFHLFSITVSNIFLFLFKWCVQKPKKNKKNCAFEVFIGLFVNICVYEILMWTCVFFLGITIDYSYLINSVDLLNNCVFCKFCGTALGIHTNFNNQSQCDLLHVIERELPIVINFASHFISLTPTNTANVPGVDNNQSVPVVNNNQSVPVNADNNVLGNLLWNDIEDIVSNMLNEHHI